MTDKGQKTECFIDPQRPDQQMGQRQLKDRGFSAAGRRRIKRRLKHYSNRLRRRHGREVIEQELKDS